MAGAGAACPFRRKGSDTMIVAIVPNRGKMNLVTHAVTGALFVYRSADVSSQYLLWAKRPLGTASAACVTTSARYPKGRFAMTKGDGKPCVRCGTSAWYDGGHCKQCSRNHVDRWRAKNKKRDLQNRRRWDRNNLEKRVAKNRRRRARKREVRGSFTAEEFRNLCEYYDNRCLCCGRKGVPLEADHIIPLSWEGSTNDISNIQPLCKQCNSSKSDHHATDYRTKGSARRWIQESLFNFEGVTNE